MHAIIHTKGVVLNGTYTPLELAYRDKTGMLCHFLITSPTNFSKMVKMDPRCRPDVLVTTTEGTHYTEVLKFLQDRFSFLQNSFPDETVVFGFKGESYQPKILKDAGITDIVNVEQFGVPPLNRVQFYQVICPWHKGDMNKCALVALNQIVSHFE